MSKKRKRIILWLLAISTIAACGAYYYTFHYGAKHKDPLKSEDKIVLNAIDLFAMYNTYEDSANKQFLDSVISVTGVIQDIELNDGRYTVTLASGDSAGAVICEMDKGDNNKLEKLNIGSTVNLVGFCNGLLIDVQMDRCKLAE